MKLRYLGCIVLLAGFTTLSSDNANAQNRGLTGLQPQNQQGGLAQGSQNNAFGLGNQSRQGQGQGGLGGQQRGGLGGRQILGRQQTQQDAFIGSDSQQVQNLFRNQRNNAGRRARFDFAIEDFNEMRDSRRRGRGQRNQGPTVNVKLKPLFSVSQPPAAEITTRVESSLTKALPTSVGSTPTVSINAGVATVRGQVDSEYNKQLVAKMVSLQPGITEVENQLTIESVTDQPLLLVPIR